MEIDKNIQKIKQILQNPNQNQLKNEEIALLRLLVEYSTLKKSEDRRRKKKSERNHRYYIKHKDEILNKNKKMRELYKAFMKS